MKKILKKSLVIYMLICTVLPMLFSNVSRAEDSEVMLTQERAGNYVSTFAINFFNNWSSEDSPIEEGGVTTEYSAIADMQNPSGNKISRLSWINFVYKYGLSLENSKFPIKTGKVMNTDNFDKIEVADLENALKSSEENSEEDSDNNSSSNDAKETTVELMNSGKILPGDILITSENDYLLYVGGTKVIYATPEENLRGYAVHPGEKKYGALRYDYIQTYFVEVRRALEEEHKAGLEPGEEDTEYEPQYGLKEIYRINKATAGSIPDSKANTMYNGRGYYDVENTYNGMPIKSSYDGSTHISLLDFIIDGLAAIFKLIVNLALFLIRAVIVGWINIFETLIQSTVLKLSGHNNAVSFVDKITGVSTTSYSGQRVTVESLLFNRLPLTDANFFDYETAGGYSLVDENGNPTSWLYNIRKNLATMYVIFRNFSIAAMLLVMLYMGIRMALSNIAERKAKYSRMLVDWLVGLCIIFFIHYFMYLVLYVNNIFVDLFMKESVTAAQAIMGGDMQELTLYDAIRTKAYSWNFYDGTVGLIMYAVMVYYFIRYLFVYLKRMIAIYVLALYGSIIGLRYAIEKSSGKGRGNGGIFITWMKDYVFNVLLQTIHCMIYVTLMSIAISSAFTSAGGIIVALLTFKFMLQADGIFMKIFNIKGGLMDDTVKPTNMQGYKDWLQKGGMLFGIAMIPYKVGKKVVSGEEGIRPLLRYSLNYRKGDTEEQTLARAENNYLVRKAMKGKILASLLPIRMMKIRRNSYKAMIMTNDYTLRRDIYNSINAEKKERRGKFTRKLNTGKKMILGGLGMMTAVGRLPEGLASSAAVFIKSYGTLKSANGDKLKMYRRYNPHTRRGLVGDVQMDDKKADKNIAKKQSAQQTLARIAQNEHIVSENIKKIKNIENNIIKNNPNMTNEERAQLHDNLKKQVQGAVIYAKRNTVDADLIRKAINAYSANGTVGKELNSSDLQGVLEELKKDIDPSKSNVVINAETQKQIEEVIANSGKTLDGKEKKEFAEILTEAIANKDEASSRKVVSEHNYDNLLNAIQKTLNNEGVSVNFTTATRNKIKEEIIKKQKGKVARGSADMAKLNANNILSEGSNAQLEQLIYTVLEEQSMINSNTKAANNAKQKAGVQQAIGEIKDNMKKIRGMDQANKAKNKENAMKYNEYIRGILDNF